MTSPTLIGRLTPLAVVLAAAPLMAQTSTGSISGQIQDAKGKPLAGARVVVSSPALFAPREMTTDARGEFRTHLLPPGNYRIVATKDGFKSRGASDVRVGLGAAVKQDLALTAIEVQSTVVEVVGSSVATDKSDTKTSVNYSPAQLEVMPTVVDRGYGSALALSPGVVTEGASSRPSIRGGSVQSTKISVNGADIKDDSRGEVQGTWMVEDNIEDIQVILSPLHARYGRAIGGQVNVVTKSGGDEWHGSMRTIFSRNSWNATSKNDSHETSRNDDLNKTWQATLSGPIVPQRLWFSLGTILTPSASSQGMFGAISYRPYNQVFQTGNPLIDAVTGTDPKTFEPTAGSKVPAGYKFSRFDAWKQFSQSTDSSYYELKLTGALAANHTLEASYMASDNKKSNTDYWDDLWNTGLMSALGERKEKRRSSTLAYRGILGDTTFLEAHFTRNLYALTYPKGDPNYGGGREYAYFDAWPLWGNHYTYVGYPFGVPAPGGDQNRNNQSVNLNLKLIRDWGVGSHELDFGLDFFRTDYDTAKQAGSNNREFNLGGWYYNGQNYLFPAIVFAGNTDANGNAINNRYFDSDNFFSWRGLEPTMHQFLGVDGTVKCDNQAFYVNDNWTINPHVSVMGGLRIEKQSITDTTGAKLANTTDFSPRFQVKYDVNGDSRKVFTFTAARLGGDFSQAFASVFAQDARKVVVDKGFTGVPNQPAAGSPNDNGYYGVRFLTWGEITNPAYYTKVFGFSDASKNVKVDPNLKSQAVDEFTVGFQRSYDSGSNVRMTYVNRSWKRNWAIAQDYALDQMVLLKDPTNSGLPSMNSQVTRVFNSDDLTRKYQSLELEFNVRTKGVWSWGGNWTYGRLTGNDEGGEQTTGSVLFDTAPRQYFYQRRYLTGTLGIPDSVFAPDGRLYGDVTHRARLYATAVLPVGKGGQLSFSWLLRYSTGSPFAINTSAKFATPMTPLGAAYPGPPTSYTAYQGGRRPFEQNDLYCVDFKVGFKMPLGLKGVQLVGDLSVNNVFNHIPPMFYVSNTAVSGGGRDFALVNPATYGTQDNQGKTPSNNYWLSPRTATATLGLRF